MTKKDLDSMDTKIIKLLIEDGRMPVGEMAKRLHVTAPTVRARIKSLEGAGLLKISGLIDPDQHGEFTSALVAMSMSIRSYGKMDQILKKIADLDNVVWASVVTGRYDIIAEVVFKGGTAELYRFTETILKMANVVRSETFVVMKSRRKWIRLPKGVGGI
jgi:Lrp/AsnC family transcriptional regulator, regulator for asnA, asnC and gidA